MLCNRLETFFDAINNEIDIDRDLIKRLGRQDLCFTPLRSLKTLKYIDKYNISANAYALFAILFTIFLPVFFLVKMLISIPKIGGKDSLEKGGQEELVLVANGRVEYLFNKSNEGTEAKFLNINQPRNKIKSHVYQSLGISDLIYAYFYAVSSVVLFLPKLSDKRDVLQFYVAYEWFLVYEGLLKNSEHVSDVYFANHYDRWAVMFDSIYSGKNIVLLQHGTLPDSLDLTYKLKNLKYIYTIDQHSVILFKRMFCCVKTRFKMLDISLVLSDVKSEKRSVLIIGQPHSVAVEVEIAMELSGRYDVFIKPHPLYDDTEYRKLKQVTIVSDREFYPKVDVALCYESTLGVEYQASGVPVVWWKNMGISDIVLQLNATEE